MASKNKLNVTTQGKGNTTIAVGGSTGYISPGNSENYVEISVNGDRLITTVVGGDVGQFAFTEFRDLLISSLKSTETQDDASDMISQLEKEANKPSKERNEMRIKRLLNSLGAYVNLASIAAANLEKIKLSFEQVRKFFGL